MSYAIGYVIISYIVVLFNLRYVNKIDTKEHNKSCPEWIAFLIWIVSPISIVLMTTIACSYFYCSDYCNKLRSKCDNFCSTLDKSTRKTLRFIFGIG